jgi:penicillin-binding protein 1A
MAKQTRKPKAKKKKKSAIRSKILRFTLLGITAAIVLLFALFGAVYIGLFGALPNADDIRALKTNNASEVYSADGALLGKYFIQNRSSVTYGDIPEIAIDALVATEDSRFFEHEGIDFYSIPRVVIKTVILGDRSGGGGSTISQQLVKNLFGRKDHGALSMPVNKLKENITALKIEDIYTKEEIITLYLNTVSFGENVFGIKAASQRYFGKLPRDLTVPEAATLIGMLKANTSYNPRLHPEASLERRNVVMALMVREGSLEPDEFHRLEAEPIKLNYQRLEGQFGPAPYLRAYIEPELRTILDGLKKENGEPYNLYADGLRITATVNSKLQAQAEKTVKAHLTALQTTFDAHWKTSKPWGKDPSFLWKEAAKSVRYQRLLAAGKSEKEIRKVFETKTSLLVYTPEGMEVKEMSPIDSVAYHQMILQAGFVAMESQTGRVLAYVGGADFGQFPYDHVQSRRQVGSTFKPFVYAAALEAGFKPCDYIENNPIIFSGYDDWSPSNAGGPEGGWYTMRGGLAKSVNVVAARLISETGFEPVRDIARRAGITAPLPKLPSIALGAVEVSLMEMVQSYSVFGNGGKAVKPIFIGKIETADGTVLYQAKPEPARRVLDENIARTMLSMLETVVDSGTARSVRTRFGVQSDLAGKTGTTQNNADGWFMAITPNLICGAWVGAESPLVRFRSTSLGQGAVTALPIAAGWIRAIERDRATSSFIGRKFSSPGAQILLDTYCPLYVENRTESFFEGLFDKDTRNEKKELRERAREEEKDPARKEKEDRWMKRLLDKLKSKEKD